MLLTRSYTTAEFPDHPPKIVAGYVGRRHGTMSQKIGGDPDGARSRQDELCRALGFHPNQLALLRVSHCGDIAHVSPGELIGVDEKRYFIPTASQRINFADLAGHELSLHDARKERTGIECLSVQHAGILLGVLPADCPCVALTNGETIALLHSGLTATVNRLVEVVARSLPNPSAWQAIIFPGIGKCCYDLNRDDRWLSHRDYVATHYSKFEQFLHPTGTALMIDLPGVVEALLIKGGIPEKQISACQACTCCSHTLDGGREFFSYFRSENINPNSECDPHGRNMMFIGIPI